MLFYDFEVFKFDWLVVIADTSAQQEYVIHNDKDILQHFYDEHKYDIWVGYNSRHYDKYILQSILGGWNPKLMNDWIIVKKKEPWQFSSVLRNFPFNNFDIMPNPPIGLKTLEGFLGSNIKETDVDFNIDRPLTPEELEMTIKYCRHDVDQTAEVFLQRKSVFDAQFQLIKIFNLPLADIGDTEARITSKVLGCRKEEFKDEYDYFFLPCIQLHKYAYVMEWFRNAPQDCRREMLEKYNDSKTKPSDRWKYNPDDPEAYNRFFYNRKLETVIAGIPHTFGFGGLHGATAEPIHIKGALYHVDVNNYYPSLLIGWNLVTRAATNDNYKLVYKTRKALKYKQTHAATKEEAKGYKTQQLPYKKLLNALSGAMKDRTNPAYDPRNNNCMCINGQLMLLDLIEKLEEKVTDFRLVQSNTDGLIIHIPDTDEVFYQMDDVCYEWECRCSTKECDIALELDSIAEIYQKDVNNYLWIDANGGIERKGAYVKELSRIDNDLPIINKALVEYMVHKTPVEQTIKECNELIEFQKLVKLSDNYKWVEHEACNPVIETVKDKKVYSYSHTEKYSYKSYRVFASKDIKDGRLLKCGGKRGKPEKFANTPDHCFIFNDQINGVKCSSNNYDHYNPDNEHYGDLDKQWYINLAKKRLKDFGIEV